MKKTIPALLLALSAPVLAECPYPLDATQAQIDAYPPTNGWKTEATSGQSIEFTVQPTSTIQAYAGFSSLGLTALANAYATGVPGGDVALPASGIARVRMNVESLPWQAVTSPSGTVGASVTLLTGNHTSATPLPKDALNYTVAVSATSNATTPVKAYISGQSIQGSTITSTSRADAMPLPFPADRIGFYLDMDTRTLGLSYRIMEGTWAPGVPPAGDYDMPINDNQGNPVRIPDGVSSVALALGAYENGIIVGDTAVNTQVKATLATDICATSSPAATLPNGKAFRGKGKAQGLFK